MVGLEDLRTQVRTTGSPYSCAGRAGLTGLGWEAYEAARRRASGRRGRYGSDADLLDRREARGTHTVACDPLWLALSAPEGVAPWDEWAQSL